MFSFAFTLYACALLFCLLASSIAHAGVGEGGGRREWGESGEWSESLTAGQATVVAE